MERRALSADLENCTVANNHGYHRAPVVARCDGRYLGRRPAGLAGPAKDADRDHRQDVKGTWWMPRHQESMKGVDGCDKPRGGAEQPAIRGCPNGETQRW